MTTQPPSDPALIADDVRIKRDIARFLWERTHGTDEGLCRAWAEGILVLVEERSEDEISRLREALGLARSMILSGESMSVQAERIINGALHIDGEAHDG